MAKAPQPKPFVVRREFSCTYESLEQFGRNWPRKISTSECDDGLFWRTLEARNLNSGLNLQAICMGSIFTSFVLFRLFLFLNASNLKPQSLVHSVYSKVEPAHVFGGVLHSGQVAAARRSDLYLDSFVFTYVRGFSLYSQKSKLNKCSVDIGLQKKASSVEQRFKYTPCNKLQRIVLWFSECDTEINFI